MTDLSVRDGDRVLPVARPGVPPDPEPQEWCGTISLTRMYARPESCKRGHARHPNPRLRDQTCPRCGRPPEGDFE